MNTNTTNPHDPGGLIAAIPHLIGFHPTDSVVLTATHDENLTWLVRVDLPSTTDEDRFLDRLLDEVTTTGDTVDLAVIHDNAPTNPASQPPARPLVQRLTDRLGATGITVRSVSWSPSTQPGAPWRDYRQPHETGTLPTTDSPQPATRRTNLGMVTYDDREQLVALIAPQTPQRVLQARADRLHSCAADAEPPHPELVHRTLHRATRGGGLDLTNEEIIRITWTLTFHGLRDSFLAHNLGPHAWAAQHLWLTLLHATPPPWRAEPASLYAAGAYIQGQHAPAAVALNTALRADPTHRLATLLDHAQQQGMTPAQLRHGITLHHKPQHGSPCSGAPDASWR